MIKKLKVKFVVLAMAAVFVLLTVVVAGMNIINYASVVGESDDILSVISKNKGSFPVYDIRPDADADENLEDFDGFYPEDSAGTPASNTGRGSRLPRGMSPETPYESRYFSVVLDSSGETVNIDTGKIASVNREAAEEYAREALETDKTRGFLQNYRFDITEEQGGVRVTFLDCGRRLDSFHSFLCASVIMAAAGLAAVFAVIFVLSGRIIRPIAESYEKQKRFITDAGHEIKTPLTVIAANADILEMEQGENECIADIKQQTERLRGLTEDLVTLARMEEAGEGLPKIEFPLSEVVSETVRPFGAIARQQNKELTCDICPMITLKGNDKVIRRLVSVLTDNALKYSPEGSTVRISLEKQNRTARLTVFNETEDEIKNGDIAHVFDRFWRADGSRNSETGGHGIGLSIAKNAVSAHNGKIYASTRDGHSFQIEVLLPL
ncbi:MAG: sensor histidine kinase [Candidatus Avispirillum sp.]